MPSPPETPITSKDIRKRERSRLGADDDEALVGLALSGGGIRSATFGLGVLQALTSLRMFDKLHYVSTVSGGGYIGGWLQAARANGRAAALELHGDEPREIRFLRAYSNYLTPRLGLFSGDTWAAVGNSLRNLILNFTILSLSLLAPLYLPWLGALTFWALVGVSNPVWVLAVTGALFTLVVAASTANMAQPLRNGGWSKSGASRAGPVAIYLTVIMPGLLAMWLTSTTMWSWATTGRFDTGGKVAFYGLFGAVAYGAVWLVGLVAGFLWRQHHTRLQQTADASVALTRAAWVATVLVITAMIGGFIGTSLMALATDAMVRAFDEGPHTWLLALSSYPVGVMCLMLGVSAHIGLAGSYLSDETREWWGRVGGVQLLISLLLIVVALMALVGPHLLAVLQIQWEGLGAYQGSIKTVLGAAWAGLTGAGVWAGQSDRTNSGAGNPVLEFAGKIAPVSFVVGYLLILSTLIHAVPHIAIGPGGAPFGLCDVEQRLRVIARPHKDTAAAALSDGKWDKACDPPKAALAATAPSEAGGLLLMLLGSAVLAWLVSRRVDLNEFSLHTFYRNRLVRCFLGASRIRDPHPFTGFDAADDVPLASLGATAKDERLRPYPLFNTAINLVGGKNLAWQQRKAASFVFTPDYCGFEYRNDDESARSTRDGEVPPAPDGVRWLSAYAPTIAHADDPRSITMGLAIATSGAAASPNMGYHSSPTLAFLMTVFNVRLGWWLRNPRDHEIWKAKASRLSIREMLYELLGMTTDDKKWVYLSDGGHFENLGIYELVRRRCRFVIACDAGQDGDVTFEDLGNAIEKCRADFGVDIDIDLTKMRPNGRYSERHCAIGTIRYDRLSELDTDGAPLAPGVLLYIKSSVTGDEPADVQRYAAEHPAFPHESTNDQWFDESQFESYRALGYHVAREVFTSAVGKDDCTELEPVEIFVRLGQRWGKPAPAPPDALRKYSAALEQIWTAVRTSNDLTFLDSQMFPEMPALMVVPFEGAGGAPARPHLQSVNYWLPDREEERRAGFYICIEMLQLMEDVFLDFDLDDHYDHIDNRGWMNLFQHWSWSGMLCATWAMTGSTFDPRFQRFCGARLDLRPGEPSVAGMDEAIQLPDPADWRAWYADGKDANEHCLAHASAWQTQGGLNFWEVELVGKYLRASTRANQRVFPVYLTVYSPRRSDGNPLRFNVGYIIGDVETELGGPSRFAIHYMRIQNHLRKMGLAREALLALRRALGVDVYVADAAIDTTVADGKASDEGLPSDDALKQLRRIVRSLPARNSARVSLPRI